MDERKTDEGVQSEEKPSPNCGKNGRSLVREVEKVAGKAESSRQEKDQFDEKTGCKGMSVTSETQEKKAPLKPKQHFKRGKVKPFSKAMCLKTIIERIAAVGISISDEEIKASLLKKAEEKFGHKSQRNKNVDNDNPIKPSCIDTVLWKPDAPTQIAKCNKYIDEFFYREEIVDWDSMSSMVLANCDNDIVNETASLEVRKYGLFVNKEVEEKLKEILEVVGNSSASEARNQTNNGSKFEVDECSMRMMEKYSKVFCQFHPARHDLFAPACGAGYEDLVNVLRCLPPFRNTENYLLNVFSKLLECGVSPASLSNLKRQWNQTIVLVRSNPSYWLNVNRTGLMRAVIFNRKRIVELLVNKNFSVNEESMEGFTPLLFATRMGNEQMMRYLINHGANVDGSQTACSPLVIAVHRGKIPVVKLLLENGACSIEDENVSILELATYKGQVEMVRFLLKMRFIIPFDSCQIKASFVLAMQLKNTLLVEIFLEAGIQLGGCKLPVEKIAREDFYHSVCCDLTKYGSDTVNDKIYEFLTPLMMSSLLGVHEIIQFLLEKGFDVNERNTYKETALSVATAYGNYDTVKFLLEKGADLKNKDSIGLTAFMRAARYNRIEIMQLLLEHGDDFTKKTFVAKEELEYDAMSIACLSGSLEAVMFLVEKGVNVCQQINGTNYIYEPLICGYTEVVQALLEVEEQQQKSKEQDLRSEAANQKVNQKEHKYSSVLVNSFLFDTRDSPLTIAARLGYTEITELLLSKGAAVEHENRAGFTALFLASCRGYQFTTEALINAGSNVNKVVPYKPSSCQSDTPEYRREEFESYLSINFKKDVSVDINKTAYTPLNVASFHGHFNVIKKLVCNGADVNPRSKLGLISPPIVMAASKNWEEVVKYLMSNGADVNLLETISGCSTLNCACQIGSLSIAKLLIKAQANLENRSLSGLTPLMEAVQNQHEEVVRVLIEANADVTAISKTSSRETALMIAIENQNSYICDMLIDGSDVNAKNKRGTTALWIACNKGLVSIVEILLKNNANVNVADNAGISPLFTAIKNGHLQVVKMLLEKNAILPTDAECSKFISSPASSVSTESTVECIKLVMDAKTVYAERARALADSFLEQLDLEKAAKKEKGKKAGKHKTKSKRKPKKSH